MNNVRIVAVTKPVIYGVYNANDFIAYCARVSNPSNQNNAETSEKLLKYLVKNKHWSPFELSHLVMEINTTRDIARQILRHRSFSFQEFSQRYADPTKSLDFTTREARLQDNKNRQNSIENENADLEKTWVMKQTQLIHESKLAYSWAIQNGIAKEQARAVLPEGLTLSKLYMSGSLRSWIHYCMLRMEKGTQKEHRVIATECWELICGEFPSLKEIIDVD